MNICLKCNGKGLSNIRLPEHNHELCCRKCKEPVIDVDDNLANIILFLNNKGFKTLHCCEGHLYINDHIGYGPSIHEGYISIEDDGTVEERLKFLPDSIKKFNLNYELCTGPRSFEDKTIVNKFILRFVRNDFSEVSFWDYQLDKISLFRRLEYSLSDNLEGGLESCPDLTRDLEIKE